MKFLINLRIKKLLIRNPISIPIWLKVIQILREVEDSDIINKEFDEKVHEVDIVEEDLEEVLLFCRISSKSHIILSTFSSKLVLSMILLLNLDKKFCQIKK